jgi:hypothetical protein
MPLLPVHSAPRRWREAFRIDTERLLEQHPILEVVRRYGVELRRTGRSFTGRCPFHVDGGRPNLVVFPRSGRWWCFRCATGGDAINLSSSSNTSPSARRRFAWVPILPVAQ